MVGIFRVARSIYWPPPRIFLTFIDSCAECASTLPSHATQDRNTSLKKIHQGSHNEMEGM